MRGDKNCGSPWHRGVGRRDYPWRCPLCDQEAHRTGMELPNGAIVMEMTDSIILAKNNTGGRDEYVTWWWDGKDLASTTFGHYHELLVLAVKDYITRVANEIEARHSTERYAEPSADLLDKGDHNG